MKTFRIKQWQTSAQHPTETNVGIEISEEIGNTGIHTSWNLQFMVPGRIESPSEGLQQAVAKRLLDAGLMTQAELDAQLTPTEAPGSSAG